MWVTPPTNPPPAYLQRDDNFAWMRTGGGMRLEPYKIDEHDPYVPSLVRRRLVVLLRACIML